MKKKFISMAVAFAAVTISANAQSYIMQIHKTDGSTVTVDADDVEKVTFAEKPYEFETVPTGTDLTTWFTENADVFSNNKVVNIPLAADGQYTMSGSIDFVGTQVSLYTVDAASPATVTMTANASVQTSTGLDISNVNFDCSASQATFIKLSETPDESIMGVISGEQNYYDIQQPLSLKGCNITGVNSYFIHDSKVKYCVGKAVISDCVVQLTGTTAVIRFETGYINDLTVENSTFWGIDGADASYFVQYNNSGRCDRGGYTSNANSGQWGNYNGFAGRNTSYWNMTNCIFVDCGNNQVPRRFVGGRVGNAIATFANNTYMYDGAFESVTGYDDSGTAIEADPGFKDAANGDFTVSGEQQIAKRTGDPRWLPEAE